MRSLIDIATLTVAEIDELIATADDIIANPAKYSEVNMLSKNVFEVLDKESENWFLLDKNGNIINKNTQRQ